MGPFVTGVSGQGGAGLRVGLFLQALFQTPEGQLVVALRVVRRESLRPLLVLLCGGGYVLDAADLVGPEGHGTELVRDHDLVVSGGHLAFQGSAVGEVNFVRPHRSSQGQRKNEQEYQLAEEHEEVQHRFRRSVARGAVTSHPRCFSKSRASEEHHTCTSEEQSLRRQNVARTL